MNREMEQLLNEIEVPREVRDRGRLGVKRAKQEMRQRPGFVRRRLMTVGIAAALLVPTGAFAYQSLLADGLYGSFDELKVHVVSATLEQYLLLDAKLQQAKGTLGDAEYNTFKHELRILTDAKMTYGNDDGNIDYTTLSDGKRAEMKAALATLQPYFDRLNDQPSSRDVLTPVEYDTYIEALMTTESLRVQAGGAVEDMSESMRTQYDAALAIIREVDAKQQR